MDTIIKNISAFANALISEPVGAIAALGLLLKTLYDRRKDRTDLKLTAEIYEITCEEKFWELRPEAVNTGKNAISLRKLYFDYFKGVKGESPRFNYYTKEKPLKFPPVPLSPSEPTIGGNLPHNIFIGTVPWLKIKDFIIEDTTGKPWKLGKRKMKALLEKAKKEA